MQTCSDLSRVDNRERSVDKWREIYAKYGGSARNLLAFPESVVESRLKAAVAGVDLSGLLNTTDFDGRGQHIEQLIQIVPREDDNKAVERTPTTEDHISTYRGQTLAR